MLKISPPPFDFFSSSFSLSKKPQRKSPKVKKTSLKNEEERGRDVPKKWEAIGGHRNEFGPTISLFQCMEIMQVVRL